jgi:hypothetical protein
MKVTCGLCSQESNLDEITIDNNLAAVKNRKVVESFQEIFDIQVRV